MLDLKGVNTHIGQYHILQGVSFEIKENALTMLLGRNGAGKTTCLRTIMGLWRASAGEIVFSGKAIHKLDTPDIARLGIAYVPENMGIFAGLTVRENLLLAAREGAPDGKRLERIFTLFPAMKKAGKNLTWNKVYANLINTTNAPAAYFSNGEGGFAKNKPYFADQVHLVTLTGASDSTPKAANGTFNGCPVPRPCWIPQEVNGTEWFPATVGKN